MDLRGPIPMPARCALSAGALVAGEAAAFGLPQAAGCWPLLGFLLATAALAAYGWGIRRLGPLLLFGLGALLAFRADARLAALLGRDAARTRLVLPVEGPVNSRPRRDGGRNVDFPSHTGPVPLKVVLSVGTSGAEPAPGEIWEVEGWLSRKEDRGNRFARRTLWVRDPAWARRTDRPAPFAARIGFHWEELGRALSRVLGAGLDWNRELAGLNRAILLGRRDEIPAARRRVFADAGTIHVFAISGLHVMVVAWMLDAGLLRFGVARASRGLFCLPPLWAYVLLTGTHPSAVRAALMASFHLVATACCRRPDALVSWSLTALAVYGLRPERLFDLGCTFSFAVMLGIVLWMRAARHVDAVFGAGSWQARLAREFGIPVAAWAAGVPIAAHVFGHVTPGGLLANFVVVKCAGPLVKFGAGALLAGAFCLPLAALLNNVAALFTWAMVLVSEGVAALPWSTFQVDPWTPAACAAWYAACLGGLLLVRRLRRRGAWSPGRWW